MKTLQFSKKLTDSGTTPKGKSVDHWLDNMSDDVKFRSLAEGAKTMEFTRTSSCKDEVRRYFAGLTAD